MRSPVSRIALVATLLLAACGGANARVSAVSETGGPGPAGDYPMVLGAPFVVDGVTYTPADTLNYDSVGYAEAVAGAGVSGAHRTLPLPSYVEVTSLDTGKTILVRLTERGPMTGNGLVALSAGAWTQLGAAPGARLPVRVRRVNPPEAERALLRTGHQAPARMDTPPGLLAALKRKLGIAPAALSADTVAQPTLPKLAAPAKPEPKVAAQPAPARLDAPVAAKEAPPPCYSEACYSEARYPEAFSHIGLGKRLPYPGRRLFHSGTCRCRRQGDRRFGVAGRQAVARACRTAQGSWTSRCSAGEGSRGRLCRRKGRCRAVT